MSFIAAVSAVAGRGRPTLNLPSPVVGYRQTQLNLVPIALWPLAESSGTLMEDVVGNRDGTYANGPTLGVAALPALSDTAVNFAGVGSATIPHDAGLALSAFTLAFWFKMNAFPLEGNRFVLVAKDLTNNNAGDTAIVVEDDGTLTIQMNAGAGSLQVPTQPLLEIGSTYHVVLRANNTGFDAYLNGSYLGKNTNFTGAWTANTRQFEIATAVAYPLSANPANFVLDEMALWDRVLSEAEVLTLTQRTDPPVAADDVAVVLESTTTPIAVLGNDIFVGATPTLSIVAQPGGGDSVAVNGLVIDYTAGAVTVNTERSFQYRVTDANGQSNVATVNVTVQDSAFTPGANANCFIISTTDTVEVDNVADAVAAINAAPPGRQVLLAPGTYAGGARNFTAQGTAANPIVLRPRDGRGTVTITNPDWTFANTSSRLVLYGFNFTGGHIEVNGDHNRITRCQFTNFTDPVVLGTARDCRVDHSDFSAMLDTAGARSCIRLDPNGFDNGTNVRNLIDHCYFHDINTDIVPPGAELVRMFNQVQNIDLTVDVCTVDHCLFRNVDIAGENEIISVKTGGFTVQFTTFENLTGSWLSLRQCNNAVVRSCWFENASSTSLNGCLAVKGNDHLIIGNRVVGGHNISCWAGNCTIEENIAGTAPTPPHPRARDCRFVGNLLDTGRIQIAAHTGIDPADPALDNNVALTGGGANVRSAGGDPYIIFDATWEMGTTFNADAEAFVAATKLAPADVGLGAADPYCLSGPQA